MDKGSFTPDPARTTQHGTVRRGAAVQCNGYGKFLQRESGDGGAVPCLAVP